MVKIRLKRMGAKKRPFYRLVVADARSPRDGRFIEAIGFYDPLTKPARVQIDEQRVRHWLGNGARPSDSARSLLAQQGLIEATPRRRPAATATAAAPAAAAETPAAAAETPAAADESVESAAEEARADEAEQDADAATAESGAAEE